MPSILEPATRRPRRRNGAKVEPLVGEIAEALLQLGGSAHRDRVIERLVANRCGAETPQFVRAKAVAVFDAHSSADGRGISPLFRKPFGPGSHRWALTLEAETFLRAGGVPLEALEGRA